MKRYGYYNEITNLIDGVVYIGTTREIRNLVKNLYKRIWTTDMYLTYIEPKFSEVRSYYAVEIHFPLVGNYEYSDKKYLDIHNSEWIAGTFLDGSLIGLEDINADTFELLNDKIQALLFPEDFTACIE